MPHVIFLHGTSSSGKSTLAKALQANARLPLWHVSSDQFISAGMLPDYRAARNDFDWTTQRPRFFEAFHQCVKAILDAGNHVILDHIIENDEWYRQLCILLSGHRVFFVGLHCDIETLRKRELSRADSLQGNRYAGEAEYHLLHVHSYSRYDYEIDTQAYDTREAAQQILNAWETQLQLPSESEFFKQT